MNHQKQKSSQRSNMKESTFLFPSTEVTITPPVEWGPRAVVRGTLDGTWTTLTTSRTEFAVTDFDATLTVPLEHLNPSDAGAPTQMTIPLSLHSFEVPKNFLPICDGLNCGHFDASTRFVTATLGIRARFPSVARNESTPSLIIMRTMGWAGVAGFQIGGGVGTFVSGLLAGAILCCAGGRNQLLRDQRDSTEKIKEDGPLVDGSNLKVDGQIPVTGDPSDEAKKLSKEPGKTALRVLKDAIDLIRRAGVFDDLNAQLKKDGYTIRITFVIRLDDKLAKEEGLSAHTECGDGFIGIEIDASAILEPYKDDIIESVYDTLIHELIHAKQCPYQKAGKDLPYGDHDDKKFKDKVKELVEKAKERAKKDQEAKEEELKKK